MNIKQHLVLLPALLFISCSSLSTDYPTTGDIKPEQKQVASSAGKFGLKLFMEINKQSTGGNIFISPLSISAALGMTLNGANGQTYDQMKSVLELNGLNQDDINNAHKELHQYLVSTDSKVKLSIANSIWYRDGFYTEPSFINTNKEYFSAQVAALDFDNPNSVNVINQWVNENTNGLIKKIINDIPHEMIMYLINAIYFKGTWTYQFKKEDTAEDLFYLTDGSTINCSMMKQENEFKYFSNNDFQAIQLPYGDSLYYMTIILPKQNQDINQIISNCTFENWQSWENSFVKSKGAITLPKTKLEYELQLKESLKNLGMPAAFIPEQADFSKINKNEQLFISEVKHKTCLEIDEEGTKAAAVTSVGVGLVSIGGDGGFYMKVNRPFITAITEKNSGSILFIGKIVKP